MSCCVHESFLQKPLQVIVWKVARSTFTDRSMRHRNLSSTWHVVSNHHPPSSHFLAVHPFVLSYFNPDMCLRLCEQYATKLALFRPLCENSIPQSLPCFGRLCSCHLENKYSVKFSNRTML